MAAVGVEAQRLIAVSLGKIAASRTQRGGINLHKNLLVASVLHKARTAYMMENFQQMLATKRAQADQLQGVSSEDGRENSTPSVTITQACHEAITSGNRSSANLATPRLCESSPVDKENTPPSQNFSSQKMESTPQEKYSSSKTDSILRNSSSLTASQQQRDSCSDKDYVSPVSSYSSCVLKRRRGNDRENEPILPKKPKFGDSKDCDFRPEPMQTEPTQISNLVSIFNTGFSGLCSRNESGDLQLSFSRPDSGSLHCGSQVENRVDAVPTAIALTV